MTLADAIRKGAAQRPQGFGRMFTREQGELRTCALGAAWEALYGAPRDYGSPDSAAEGRQFDLYFGLLDRARHPHMDMRTFTLGWVVADLNDEHRWTREAIAEWLDQGGAHVEGQ